MLESSFGHEDKLKRRLLRDLERWARAQSCHFLQSKKLFAMERRVNRMERVKDIYIVCGDDTSRDVVTLLLHSKKEFMAILRNDFGRRVRAQLLSHAR